MKTFGEWVNKYRRRRVSDIRGFRSLIGKRCQCVFDLEANDWPIPGFPAWVQVVDVDMPMVCMKVAYTGKSMWVNASIIKTIEAVE